MEPGEQVKRLMVGAGPGRSRDLVIPNSKLKLMDQLREVMPLQQTQISGMFTDSSARLASCQLVQFVSFGAGLSDQRRSAEPLLRLHQRGRASSRAQISRAMGRKPGLARTLALPTLLNPGGVACL